MKGTYDTGNKTQDKHNNAYPIRFCVKKPSQQLRSHFLFSPIRNLVSVTPRDYQITDNSEQVTKLRKDALYLFRLLSVFCYANKNPTKPDEGRTLKN